MVVIVCCSLGLYRTVHMYPANPLFSILAATDSGHGDIAPPVGHIYITTNLKSYIFHQNNKNILKGITQGSFRWSLVVKIFKWLKRHVNKSSENQDVVT